MLRVISSIPEMVLQAKRYKEYRLTIGFVPTMGALHEGHLSLVRKARQETDRVIVSIFVNPRQFGKNEDFAQYPRTFDRDRELLLKEGADVIFNPDAKEMYPEGFCTEVIPRKLEDKLCGKSRPGHFRGVALVVLKLLNIIKPDIAFFGQKDFQQTVIIKRMVSDLNVNTEIKVLPTLRDRDGLALSSRNTYLTGKERKEALCLYKALERAQRLVSTGVKSTEDIIHEMNKVIQNYKNVCVDYISIVNPVTLEEVPTVSDGAVAVIAVWIGKTRLIDNMILYSGRPRV